MLCWESAALVSLPPLCCVKEAALLEKIVACYHRTAHARRGWLVWHELGWWQQRTISLLQLVSNIVQHCVVHGHCAGVLHFLCSGYGISAAALPQRCWTDVLLTHQPGAELRWLVQVCWRGLGCGLHRHAGRYLHEDDHKSPTHHPARNSSKDQGVGECSWRCISLMEFHSPLCLLTI